MRYRIISTASYEYSDRMREAQNRADRIPVIAEAEQNIVKELDAMNTIVLLTKEFKPEDK